jgi:hypothetical protein
MRSEENPVVIPQSDWFCFETDGFGKFVCGSEIPVWDTKRTEAKKFVARIRNFVKTTTEANSNSGEENRQREENEMFRSSLVKPSPFLPRLSKAETGAIAARLSVCGWRSG